jgi:hypothetical protein
MSVVWLALAAFCLEGEPPTPEDKALAYLAVEVPRWSSENHCYSCHNNGDAARALFKAIQLGRSVKPEATLDTERWLSRPEGWDKNGGDGPFSDKLLARLQFASALGSAFEAGRVHDREILRRAGVRLADDQAGDGSWKIDEQSRVGSSATYGQPLATWTARETLRIADPERFRERISRADAWLRRQPVETVMDASTMLLSRAFEENEEGFARRRLALERLAKSQRDGGWGPFAMSQPEPFDTALALLALDRYRDQPGVLKMIGQGRAYLIDNQEADGSWVETTRPAGADSYAQRLSTTGWATLALLSVKAP